MNDLDDWTYQLQERESIMYEAGVVDSEREAWRDTKRHFDGVLPPAAWGSGCGRGWVSNARFGSGQVIKPTRRQ